MSHELADVARSVIDANRYMTLGTADEKGHPWVTPMWFASEDYRSFHWVSSPHAKLIPGRDPDRGSGIDRSERVSLD